MSTYSFMRNLPENYSIFDMKNKRKPPVKTERRNGNLCKSKKLYPRLFGGGDTISVFFNDFYIFYQPLYAIVALQPLNHSLPNNLAA